MKQRISLIPSYEPDDALLKITQELLETHNFTVFVVNDGSEASYNEIFDKLDKRIHYIHYKKNKGKGYALKVGLSFIQKHFKDNYIVVTMDSDGQHKVEDAVRVCDACEEKGSFVLGSRYFDKKAPFKSRFGNWMARTTFLISTHHKIYDTQTGLRAFDSSLIDTLINVEGNRYEYEMNVLLALIRQKTPIEEVKIETIYFNDNKGTHYNPLKDTWRIFKEVIKFSASSLIGFLVDYSFYTILTLVLPQTWAYRILISNIVARVISASVNFTINYKIVFKSKANVFLAILKYATLAVFILACNTALLWLLTEKALWNPYLAKILVEVTMFIVSWLVQRLFVFRKRRK